MDFYDLSSRDKRFYRNLYTAIDTVCKTEEHYIKQDNTFNVLATKMLLSDLFEIIRRMEKKLIGNDVDVTDLNLDDKKNVKVRSKINFINEEINRQFDYYAKKFLSERTIVL